MSNKQEIREEELDRVNGGKITYTWNSEQGIGTIGINGNNNFILMDLNAYGSYYYQHKDTMTDREILSNLLAQGVIKNP